LLPFKKGAFHLAIQAGVPIVPVVVQNYAHVLHLQDMTFEPGTIKVKVIKRGHTVEVKFADQSVGLGSYSNR
jgi:lysophosphatidate acyltransferase